MRFAGKYLTAGVSALFACAAVSACTYDFDGLVAHAGSGGTGGAGGSSGAAGADDDGGGAAGAGGAGGSAGSGGAAGTAGSGGAAGTAVDGGKAGTDGGSGKGGTAGTDGGSGKGGTAGTDGGAGKGGTAGTDAGSGKGGTAGTADAAADRGADAGDARSEPLFDCTAVSGTVYQGHCYYASSNTTNWDTAKTTGCASPSHLAVITDAAEQGVVAAILPGKDRWIGMRKDAGSPNMKSSLYWVTGEAISYEIWDSYETGAPEPNFTGDCVRMSPTDKWGDTGCNMQYAAICEFE